MPSDLTVAMGLSLAAAVAGVLLARRFRAPALLFTSAFTMAGIFALLTRYDWPVTWSMACGVFVTGIMQGGYLVGIALFSGRR